MFHHFPSFFIIFHHFPHHLSSFSIVFHHVPIILHGEIIELPAFFTIFPASTGLRLRNVKDDARRTTGRLESWDSERGFGFIIEENDTSRAAEVVGAGNPVGI